MHVSLEDGDRKLCGIAIYMGDIAGSLLGPGFILPGGLRELESEGEKRVLGRGTVGAKRDWLDLWGETGTVTGFT